MASRISGYRKVKFPEKYEAIFFINRCYEIASTEKRKSAIVYSFYYYYTLFTAKAWDFLTNTYFVDQTLYGFTVLSGFYMRTIYESVKRVMRYFSQN